MVISTKSTPLVTMIGICPTISPYPDQSTEPVIIITSITQERSLVDLHRMDLITCGRNDRVEKKPAIYPRSVIESMIITSLST
jgi:hypothetical protein